MLVREPPLSETALARIEALHQRARALEYARMVCYQIGSVTVTRSINDTIDAVEEDLRQVVLADLGSRVTDIVQEPESCEE